MDSPAPSSLPQSRSFLRYYTVDTKVPAVSARSWLIYENYGGRVRLTEQTLSPL